MFRLYTEIALIPGCNSGFQTGNYVSRGHLSSVLTHLLYHKSIWKSGEINSSCLPGDLWQVVTKLLHHIDDFLKALRLGSKSDVISWLQQSVPLLSKLSNIHPGKTTTLVWVFPGEQNTIYFDQWNPLRPYKSQQWCPFEYCLGSTSFYSLYKQHFHCHIKRTFWFKNWIIPEVIH